MVVMTPQLPGDTFGMTFLILQIAPLIVPSNPTVTLIPGRTDREAFEYSVALK